MNTGRRSTARLLCWLLCGALGENIFCIILNNNNSNSNSNNNNDKTIKELNKK